MSASNPTRPPVLPPKPLPIEMVRYSLPEMLAELKVERATSILAMEKLQQADIGNLFQNKPRRRRGKSE